MISGMVGRKGISRGTMLAAKRTGETPVVYVSVLDMLGEVVVTFGLSPTVDTGEKIFPHMNNLSFNHLIYFFKKLFS